MNDACEQEEPGVCDLVRLVAVDAVLVRLVYLPRKKDLWGYAKWKDQLSG